MRVTQHDLQRMFTYDPDEPLALRWKDYPELARIVQVGDIAGHWRPMAAGSTVPLRCINVGKIRIPTHRAVWLYIKGVRPPKKLGFRNGDRGDCRIENLVENPKAISVEQARKVRTEAPITLVYRNPKQDWSTVLRNKHFKNNYNLTPQEYQRMFDAQAGVCAICKRPERMVRHGKLERLSIDHCHETGIIRGLLCTNCNNGIGRFEDNTAWLHAAVAYLETPRVPKPRPKQISLFDDDIDDATAHYTHSCQNKLIRPTCLAAS